MKKFTFKLGLTAFAALAFVLCSITVKAQTVIWSEDFNGAIPSTWTINSYTCNAVAGPTALWKWKSDGTANQGAYYGTLPAISSPSVANGAAVFDSDFMDTDGTQGAFGTGTCPGPQVGDMTSPSINCSASPDVAVQFNQFFRNFQTTVFLEASNDGGITWTQYPLNTGIATNARTGEDDVQLIDISGVAGGQANVNIRFTWNGNFYFWIIDDVAVVELPGDWVCVEEVARPIMYGMPMSQPYGTIMLDDSVCNYGANTQMVTQVVRAFGGLAGGTTAMIWSDSAAPVSVPRGSCEFIDPPDFSGQPATVETYAIQYEAKKPATNFLNCDVKNEFYEVTADRFRKGDNTVAGGLRSGSADQYEFGYVFPVTGGGYQVDSVTFAVSFGTAAPANEQVFVKIYKSKTPSCEIGATATADSLEWVGFGTYTFDASYTAYQRVTIGINGVASGNAGLPVDAGCQYAVMLSYQGASTCFTGYGANIDYGFTAFTHDLVIDDAGQLFTGGFTGADRMPFLPIKIGPLAAPPVANFTFMDQGSGLVDFTDASSNNPSGWAWDFGDGQNSTVQNPQNQYMSNSSYNVCLTATNSAGNSPQACQTITVSSVNTSTLDPEDRVQLYPNPATTQITLDFELKNMTPNMSLEVTDAYGQLLINQELENVQSAKHGLDVSTLGMGTYFMKVTTDVGYATQRFVIAR